MSESSIRVLVVDDRADNRLAIEAALKGGDYTLVSVASGAEALRYLLQHDCALILMDVQMPDMDGFETVRLIKQSPRSRETPIIFLTAINKERVYVEKGYAGGAVDYLFKPFDPDVLKAKVAVFAQLYRSKQEILRQAALLREHEEAARHRLIAELELKRVQREHALQQRYRHLVDGIEHAIIWAAASPSLSLSFVSPSAIKILGHALEKWREPTFWEDHLHPDDRARVLRQLRALEAGAGLSPIEHRLRKADGSYAWLQTSARDVETPEGGREIHGLSVDLTRQKNAEDALRLVATASAELSQSLEPEQCVQRLLSLLVPELALWAMTELDEVDKPSSLHGMGAAECAEQISALCALGEPLPFARVASKLGPREAAVWLERNAALDETGEASETQRMLLARLPPTACLTVPLMVADRRLGQLTLGISGPELAEAPSGRFLIEELGRRAAQAIENARLYQHAQESVSLREDFLSVASHELRTPLTPLKLQLGVLEQLIARSARAQEQEEVGRKFAAVQRHLDRLSRLVESLLDVSRIRTGKMELQCEPVDLSAMVQEVVARFRDQLSRDGIEVTSRVAAGLVGHWDRSRIDQVVTNLLTNAIKYGERRPVEIRGDWRDEEAVLVIQDQGIGIEGPNPDRVFHRFERAVDARSYGGLGLGLYIVRQLVEAHGGRVSVHTRQGEGSTFTVVLPRRAVHLPRPAPQRVEAALSASAE